MSNDKIHLPDFLIADLYRSTLVEIGKFAKPDEVVHEIATPADTLPVVEKKEVKNINVENILEKAIIFSGENKRNITVIVNEPETTFLQKEDLTFLSNILKACQLTLADIAIVNIAGKNLTHNAIKEELKTLYFIMFGVSPSDIKLPFTVPPFQIQNYDGIKVMTCPALSKINQTTQEGKLLKTKLWVSLKQIFDIA